MLLIFRMALLLILLKELVRKFRINLMPLISNAWKVTHFLFLVEQMKYHFISGVEQQYDFLYQLEIQHNWEDPMAIYMNSGFSKGFSLLEIEIKVEYVVQIKFIFQMINSSLISI